MKEQEITSIIRATPQWNFKLLKVERKKIISVPEDTPKALLILPKLLKSNYNYIIQYSITYENLKDKS